MRFFALLLAGCLFFGILAPLAQASPASQRRALALAAALKKQRLTNVKFEEVDLKGVVKWLRTATGRNFVIDQKAILKADIDIESIRYTITLTDVTVATLLGVLLEPHALAAVVKDNVVFITSKKASYGKPVTKMYPISHITWTRTDFIPPDINLRPSGFIEDEYEPEVIHEDDPLTDGEAVAELLKTMVLPDAWDENDDWTIRGTKTYLIVRAPKAVHAKIPRAIEMIAAMK